MCKSRVSLGPVDDGGNVLPELTLVEVCQHPLVFVDVLLYKGGSLLPYFLLEFFGWVFNPHYYDLVGIVDFEAAAYIQKHLVHYI